MARIQHLILTFLIMTLTGCVGGAVVYAPTPLPPDQSPVRYQHPSGAFSLVVPRDWAVFETESQIPVSASFSPPESDVPLISIAIINLGADSGDTAQFGERLLQYQTQLRPDLERYQEQDRQAMGDGSWRLTGLRTSVGGQTEQVNTFIQQEGALFSVIEVLIPSDPARRSEIQTIINTYQLNPAVELPQASLSALSASASSDLEIVNVAVWHTLDNVFYITGEVANHGTETYIDIPIRAVLRADDVRDIAEAVDMVMGYGLRPGEFAPFSLRFGQGQPVTATNYALIVGGGDWQPETNNTIIAGDAFSLTDESNYNDNGVLQVFGTITNNTTQAVQNVRVVLTVFDERQRVVGARFIDVPPVVLEADESTEYFIPVPELGGTAANYIVVVQALPCDTECS